MNTNSGMKPGSRLGLRADGSVEVGGGGVSLTFAPRFLVLHRADRPAIRYGQPDELKFKYNVPYWQTPDGGETADYTRSAPAVELRASAWLESNGVCRWQFAETSVFMLSADVAVPEDGGPPIMEITFVPKKEGWYSIGYTGAPEKEIAEVEGVWQPLVWQERRFPKSGYLTAEFNCPLPGTLVTAGGVTTGVAADPSEMPFRIPTKANSRFGVSVRNARGLAQSMLFAPILGGEGSYMQAGEPFRFRLRLIVRPGDWVETFEHMARELFRLRDMRENTLCSLNQTLENMIEYAMSDYSAWNAELKGSSYQTDVKGAVKNVSPLHPLSLSLLTDNEKLYRERALPMMEYMMSREKYLFTTDEGVVGQGASPYMRGPSGPASELASLYNISQERSAVFRHYGEAICRKPPGLTKNYIRTGNTWQNALARYRMTGDPGDLQEARDGADAYIRERMDEAQTEFAPHSFFWTEYTPKWADLLELYETCGEQRYLEAARRGARMFCTVIWMCPAVPDEEILVNKGGQATIYGHTKSKQPIPVPEEAVPAWRVSETGLASESSPTAHGGHRGIFMTHYAPYFLRLAHYTDDPYLRTLARWAVVGRYANFPGYHINTSYTTVYEKPDYPLRPYHELSYNSFHFNHIWPHIAMTADYLVADVLDKSEGAIRFPSQYAEGYAYMQTQVYGDRPGRFYGDGNVWLWMPKGLFSIDNVQVNYVAARGEQTLYAAFANQSSRPVKAEAALDTARVACSPGQQTRVRVWVNNERADDAVMTDGRLSLELPPGGLVAVAIDGVAAVPAFQHKVLAPSNEDKPLSEESFRELDTPVGKLTAMLISMGSGLTSAYVYLEDTGKIVKEARMHYLDADGAWRTKTVSAYPFEFSVHLADDAAAFEFYVEAVKHRGDLYGIYERSEQVALLR